MSTAPPIVLASASPVRARLLADAGIACDVVPALLDEAGLRAAMKGQPPDQIATALAVAKAQAVAIRHDGAVVIGADQLLVLDGEVLAKPETRDAARRQLMRLRGKTHRLVSAVACVKGEEVRGTACDGATLTMRAFSDAFLDDYLEQAGPAVLQSVGAYQLEGLGAQLFDAIEGDYFTVLGLPLLPLLQLLRREGVIAS